MSISNSQAASLEELRQIALDHFWPHEQQVADFAKPMASESRWKVKAAGSRTQLDVSSSMPMRGCGFKTWVMDVRR